MTTNEKQISDLQENLELLRKLYGWTAEQLGDRLGISKQSVLNLEKGSENGGVKMTMIQYIAIRAVFEAELENRKGEEKKNLQTILGLILNDDSKVDPKDKERILDTAKVVSSAMMTGDKAAAVKTMSVLLAAVAGAAVVTPVVGGAVVAAGTLAAWMSSMLKNKKKKEIEKKER